MANRKIGGAELERRRGIVRRWLGSGESAAEFGGRHGISQWALYAWARQTQGARRRGWSSQTRPSRPAAGAPAERQDFVAVQLVPDEHAAAWSADGGYVEIQLRSGDVVRVVGEVSRERVAVVLAAVRQAC